MNFSRNQIIVISGAGFIVLFFILLFLGLIPGLKPSSTGGGLPGGSQVILNFWGTAEAGGSSAIHSLIDEFLKTNKNVSINYQQFDNADIYQKTLVNALATGQGPDIFMFRSNWLVKHYNKVSPLPDSALVLSQLRQLFPQVVEQDFVISQKTPDQTQTVSKIYALPLYIDTLALIYNKDIFDASSVALAPKTWLDFQNLIPKLKQTNILNQISRSAAAIGGSNISIDSASDLLNLLMLQFGSQFANLSGEINFGHEGLSAFNFYLQFADPNSQYYTWNDNLNSSLNSFSQGQAAMIFNYASSLPLIKQKNPYLNIGVSPMLQFNLSQPVNFADYWGLSVSNQSRQQNLSWQFILAATANSQISEAYLQAAKKPAALRTLIEKYKNDPDFGIFVSQALTSRSWQQPDSNTVKQSFSDMIQSVLNGRLNSQQALNQAQNQINQSK